MMLIFHPILFESFIKISNTLKLKKLFLVNVDFWTNLSIRKKVTTNTIQTISLKIVFRLQ